jgi:hypothetical protein
MQSIDINIKILYDDYPILFKLKKKELNKIIDSILKTGYNFLYPKIDDTNIKKKIEYTEIITKIEQLKLESSNPLLIEKISSLELSLEKLIGLSTSSSKKGEFAENLLENIFSQRYGDIQFKKTNSISHSGDAWLYLPNDKVIMLESKNYTYTVNKDEVTKMENDMITNHILWGIIISFNSNIQGLKEMDYYTFYHNNECYNIISISNLSSDINKLDLALIIIRKLMELDNNNIKFPWIVNNIKNDITELNSIIQKNYLIRDNFLIIEKEINKSLNGFYTKLRDSQYELEQVITKITNNIHSTIDESIDNNIKNLFEDIVQYCLNKDKKLVCIISKIIDVLTNKNIIIKKNDLYEMIKNNELVGIIKIQNKKIILEFINFDIILNFICGKEKEINQNIIILENIL